MLTIASKEVIVGRLGQLDSDFDKLVGSAALLSNQDRIRHWHHNGPVDLESLLYEATKYYYAHLSRVVQLVICLKSVVH